MSILISAKKISKNFGARSLFEDLDFVVESGERIGLIGPNGAGKSTLLRILSKEISPDSGEISTARGLRIGYLRQNPVLPLDKTVEEVVLGGPESAHEAIARIGEVLSLLSLDGHRKVGELSGGWQRRVALAKELVGEPDVLLLDEPTNHLDVETIEHLEGLLKRAPYATVTITHDRVFLQNVSNRLVELDRRLPSGLLSVRGDYATYLEVKAEQLEAQEQKEVTLRNKLRRETEWLRRGPKARTTKQQARIDRHGDLSAEVKELSSKNQKSTASFDFQSAGRAPKKLIEAVGLSKSYGSRCLFRNLDLLVGPESRIGLLGPNGCGKSTLIRTLLGSEEPDAGKIFRSDRLKVAYFEQTRSTLDPEVTLWKTLAPTGEHVPYRGKMVHVRSYLGKFLFSNEQMEMRVGKLSGGEQSRLLVARLMLNEANVLVLDEPTNDLDVATLDVLEECLTEFEGAVFLVTHDRYFLDQVANEILAFDTRPGHEGEVTSFAGLSQWENWKASLPSASAKPKKEAETISSSASPRPKKWGHKEQREFNALEPAIEKAEARLETLNQQAGLPENISNSGKLSEIYSEISSLQSEIERLYARWGELDAMREQK